MIEHLHHVLVAMPEGREDEARAFYGGVPGLPGVGKPPPLRDRGGVWFEKARLRLHIGVEKPFTPASKAHPAFRVTSLRAMAAHLMAAGISYRTGIDLPGIRRLYVSDAFGNRIELPEVFQPGRF